MFGDLYKNKKVLVTGHTGFKGSWLALWLQTLGAEVSGLSLPPVITPNHWELLALDTASYLEDIRNQHATAKIVNEIQPEVVFHLAAQPLVRQSYLDPVETWSTNVQGTVNLLEACRKLPCIRAIIVITTDKVYENCEWQWGYREIDRLGGHDPYSASKACSELVVQSYRKSYFEKDGTTLLATVRAGNVIGGGDWSADRLIPDVIRATNSHGKLQVRSPNSTRPWQHVLESLCGYLLVGQRLLNCESEFATSWNFGPDPQDNRRVGEVLELLKTYWPAIAFEATTQHAPHEAKLLYLDNSMAKHKLSWRPVWSLERGIAHTAGWYQAHANSGQAISRQQLELYVADAVASRQPWTLS